MRQVIVALLLSLAGILALVYLFVGRSDAGVDRRDHVHRNMALLRSVPVFPGATALPGRTQSLPYYDRGHDGAGPPIGYTTRAYYQVPPRTNPATVVRFFRSRLEQLGWQVSLRAAPRRSRAAEFERDGSAIAVYVVRRPVAKWRVELTIDQHANS